MKKYLLILGNSPDLAKEELKSLLPKFNEIFFKPPLLVVETDEVIPFGLLGGAIKIAQEADLNQSITTDFGISDYTGNVNILKLCKEIKAETGKRFVLPKEGRVLSSVVVKKQKLTELIFTPAGIFKTVDVQDFEDWGKRDYARPAVQAHIGMLPPKVARMMVNISQGKTILDPFCGVGTIISEGCELGLNMIGSDIDAKQVERTKTNLKFFNQKAEVFVCDARQVGQKVQSVDAIVTEVDLGPNTPNLKFEIRNLKLKDLNKLYMECFEEWKKLLKPGGRVVIALPSTDVVDKVISIGYILESGPFIYAREQAIIKRHILVFKYGTY